MAATISLPLLERARIAAPCPAKWEDMTGNDKVRHCALCNLNVHNFSAMSRDEAEGILSRHFNPDGSPIESAGRVCGGFYRRADGTYLLQNCPTGLAALRAKVRWAWLRLAAAIGLINSAALAIERQSQSRTQQIEQLSRFGGEISIARPSDTALKHDEPFRSAWQLIKPQPVQKQMAQQFLGGLVAVPPPPSKTTSNR